MTEGVDIHPEIHDATMAHEWHHCNAMMAPNVPLGLVLTVGGSACFATAG